MTPHLRDRAVTTLFLLTAACGGDATPGGQAQLATQAGPSAASVELTGDTVTVEMGTDADGSWFRPAQFTVKRGDVVSFVLVSGVHNVSFPVDSNPAGASLPAASDMLQLPGQTSDVTVSMAAGDYYFHCDPHALLGMVGRFTVE